MYPGISFGVASSAQIPGSTGYRTLGGPVRLANSDYRNYGHDGKENQTFAVEEWSSGHRRSIDILLAPTRHL